VIEFLEIHWTSGSLDEARRISRFLVQERLVGSAQIIPWIESIYLWDNQLETTQESKIVLKAPSGNYPKIEEIIRKNSSYQVVEILCFKIESGSSECLQWLAEATFGTP